MVESLERLSRNAGKLILLLGVVRFGFVVRACDTATANCKEVLTCKHTQTIMMTTKRKVG